MPTKISLLRWLTVAALADWLITRSLARMAIFMPKSPLVLSLYSALIWVGQFASTLCALAGWLAIGWIAWRLWSHGRLAPSLALGCLVGLNVCFILAVPSAGLFLFTQLLLTGTIAWLGYVIWNNAHSLEYRIAALLPALAVWTGSVYHTFQALGNVILLSEPYWFANNLFNIGELLFVLTPFGLWIAFGRENLTRRTAIAGMAALLPAALFLVAWQANPSMTGILAIWSTGLTLYLPALLYAASMWFAGFTMLVSHRKNRPTIFVLLLMISAGYAPQLSSQVTLSLVALSLLANLWGESAARTSYRLKPAEESLGSVTAY